MFDYIVIGKGLIGTAAAKYLSEEICNVAIIGPDEPTGNLNNAVVFSSHYDSGRVQRVIGWDAVWTRLNAQSVKQYPFLQKETNIRFHESTGRLYVTPDAEDPYLKQYPELAKEFNVTYDYFDSGELIHQHFPEYVFPSDVKATFESSPSGHINPRLLIKAQLTMFQNNGGAFFTDTVSNVTYHDSRFSISTIEGNEFEAKKVLLSTGAFTNFLGLCKKKLAFIPKSETIILAKVSRQEAQRLSKLPSLLYEITNDELDEIYLVKPVLYPDGNYYLKMGCNLAEDIFFKSLEEIQQWFRNGNSDAHLPIQKRELMKIIPSLSAERFSTKRCIIERTITKQPYIDMLDDRGLFVAAGGNGYGAMCSDELGRVAASLVMSGTIPGEYPAGVFRAVFEE